MPDPSVWSRSVPLIINGQPVSAAVTNAPLQVLVDRVSALKTMIDAITAGRQLILENAPIKSDVAAGNIVYFNATESRCEKAKAAWSTLITTQGRLEPADSAVFVGIVLEKSTATTGTILLNGLATLTAAAELVLFNGITPSERSYYLSMLAEGTVTDDVPTMAVRAVQYFGSSVIRVLQPQIEPLTHSHKAYRLHSEDWIIASAFDPAIVPAGAVYGYNLDSVWAQSQALSEVLLPVVGEASFVWLYKDSETASSSSGTASSSSPTDTLGGKHVDSVLIRLDEHGIWWFDATLPGQDIELTQVMADTRGVAVLNTIQSLSPTLLTITTTNGRVKCTVNDPPGQADTDYHVVKSISGGKQGRGPMVRKVLAGHGLRSSSPQGSGQGDVTVELAEFHDLRIEAGIQNLNNAIVSAEAPYVFTLFPQTRLSSVLCRVSLPNLSGGEYSAYIWLQCMSPDANQAGPDLEIVFIPTPDAAGVIPSAPIIGAFPTFPATVAAGTVYLLESISKYDLEGYSGGAILFTLTADNPVKELRMVNAGVRLELNT